MQQHDRAVPWINSLSRLVRNAGGQIRRRDFDQLDDCCIRVAMVARLRWIMLIGIAAYAVVAAVCFSVSSIGFCFGTRQTTFLVLSVVMVIIYNFILSSRCSSLKRFPYLIHLQIGLDLLFATTLVHLTGGAVSWFWPVYLLVTFESAFLFEDRRDVWLIGTLGAAFYGALLLAESVRLLHPVSMPFVDPQLHNSFLFQLLMWCWVAGMNATLAVVGAFLMDAIRRDRRRVKESEEALLGFIGTANDLIFCCNSDGQILYANQVFCDLLHVELEGLHRFTLYELISPETCSMLQETVASVLRDGIAAHQDVAFPVNGSSVDVEMNLTYSMREGDVQVVWGVCRDVTDKKRAQTELYKLAHHDNLTGLPNRILLEDRLQQAKALSHRLDESFALLFLDLDRFKIINDTLGHSVGDELLRLVAGRLRRTLRETDTVARIGGDEFIIILTNVGQRTDVSQLTDKILKALALPFHLRDHELFITTSLGICMFPEDEQNTEAMMKKADIAMYHAKALGRNNFQFYNDQMDQNASRRFIISNSLRRGLEHGEFKLYYQPKVDVSSGRIVAMEALVRWEHPELGLLSPIEFIQLAEENGLIMQLGEWVLREACRQNVCWHREGIAKIRVAVNLSGYQLQHRNLLANVEQILEETGMSPDDLEFEITESVIMQNPDFAVSVLTEFSDLGIHISIDDFGTGYSSLAHLKRFSVNTLKIDKSFVRDVELNTTDAAIATAIIAMGNSLNLNVIAEGVETQAQYDFLKENNCDQVQGFLFSRPLPSDEIVEILKQNYAEVKPA